MIDHNAAVVTIEMPAVPATLDEGSSDEQLIAAARKYARSVDGHVRAILDRKRRVIQDFHKLGEMLAYLYRRRPMGEWGKTLKEIGVSTTTDSYARKFFNAVTFERLDEFTSKTEALEKLGILNRKPKTLTGTKTGMVLQPTEVPAPQPNSDGVGPRSEPAPQPGQADDATEPAPKPARVLKAVQPVPPAAQSAPQTAKEMLAKVVRALEEVGEVGGVDAEAICLLDRAAVLLDALRGSMARRDAA